MISIICTNCKKELLLDDAFAGGVCRCQFCGAIQKVPATASKSSSTSAAASASPPPVAAPSLLVKPVRNAPPSSEKSKPVKSFAAPPADTSSSTFAWAMGIAVGLLVLLIGLGIVLMRH